MKTLLLAALFLAVRCRCPRGARLCSAEHGDYAQLTQLKLPDVRITEAAAVPASAAGIKVAHCR
jgi:hypothetical protein